MSDVIQPNSIENQNKVAEVPLQPDFADPAGKAESLANDQKVTIRSGETLWQKAVENYGHKVPLAALYEANGQMTPEVYFDTNGKRHFKAPTILAGHEYILPAADKIKALEAAFWARMKPSIDAAQRKTNSGDGGNSKKSEAGKTDSSIKTNSPKTDKPAGTSTDSPAGASSAKKTGDSALAEKPPSDTPASPTAPARDNSPEAKKARNEAKIQDLLAQNHALKEDLQKYIQSNGSWITNPWDSIRDNIWGNNEDTTRGFTKVLNDNEKQILALRDLLAASKTEEAVKSLSQLATRDPFTGRFELRLAQKYPLMKEHYATQRNFGIDTTSGLSSGAAATTAFVKIPGPFPVKALAAVSAGILPSVVLKSADNQIHSSQDFGNAVLGGGATGLFVATLCGVFAGARSLATKFKPPTGTPGGTTPAVVETPPEVSSPKPTLADIDLSAAVPKDSVHRTISNATAKHLNNASAQGRPILRDVHKASNNGNTTPQDYTFKKSATPEPVKDQNIDHDTVTTKPDLKVQAQRLTEKEIEALELARKDILGDGNYVVRSAQQKNPFIIETGKGPSSGNLQTPELKPQVKPHTTKQGEYARALEQSRKEIIGDGNYVLRGAQQKNPFTLEVKGSGGQLKPDITQSTAAQKDSVQSLYDTAEKHLNKIKAQTQPTQSWPRTQADRDFLASVKKFKKDYSSK